ncbi:stage V sporulation protein AC [Paenibacillus chartarius]|uniref:Stage V sporulation protein AC n=1 Tax=Paenibacillus chartarius TaxID=747481 RepID=A0ABV6DT85_9BACL
MTTAAKPKGGFTKQQKQYQDLAKKMEPKRSVGRNCTLAFLVGGAICTFGEALMKLFQTYFGFTEETAGNPTVAVLIFISVVLTSFGVYDKIAQWAGAGTAVPVTGFANSMSSAALEARSEGFVLGVASQMFKLAGAVISYGVVAAFFIGIVYWIFGLGG